MAPATPQNSISGLSLSYFSDTFSKSWFETTSEDVLSPLELNSLELFKDSVFRSFLKSIETPAIDEKVQADPSLFSSKLFSDSSTKISQIPLDPTITSKTVNGSSKQFSKELNSHTLSNTDDHIYLSPSDFLDTVTIDRNPMAVTEEGKNSTPEYSFGPLDFHDNLLAHYEPLPATLKSSSSSLNKIKRVLLALKASRQHLPKETSPNFDAKPTELKHKNTKPMMMENTHNMEKKEVDSFLNDEYYFEDNKTTNSVSSPVSPRAVDIKKQSEKKKKKKKTKKPPTEKTKNKDTYPQLNDIPPLKEDQAPSQLDSFWLKFEHFTFFQRNIHDYTQETIFNDGSGHFQVFRLYASGISIKFYSNFTAREKLPSTFVSSPELSDFNPSLQGSIFYYLKGGLQKKQIMANNDVIHYYLDTGITCIICAKTGTKTYKWPNGHIERYFSSTTMPFLSMENNEKHPGLLHEIVYPDGTIYQRLQSGKTFFLKR